MRKPLVFLFFIFIATVSFSQNAKPFNNIKQLTDSIDAIVQREHITGLMVGITTKDSVLFSGGFGYADLDTKRKVDNNTLFRMGSVTKMFVSLGIMKLVNEGKLSLDDELKKIAPEVPFQNKWEGTNPVRIVNLLEHTSGFDDIKLNRMYSFDTNENKGIDMVLVEKNSLVCRWKPGERTAYSNPNYAILGYLIEKLSSMPYDMFLQENILSPLGMLNSNFNVRSKLPDKDVKEYIIKNGQAIKVNSVTLLSGPQGALWSSSSEMIMFIQMFLRDGSPLCTLATISEIETPHSSLAAQFGLKNGYSLGNDNGGFAYAKYPFRGHEGIAGTCFSSCKYNSELGVGYVVASNCNNDNYIIEKLIVSYLEQNLPGKVLATQPIDKAAIEPFLGRYQFESPRNEISAFADKLQDAPKLYFEKDKLCLKPLLGPPSELLQTAAMTFAYKGQNMASICFVKNTEGKNIMMIKGNYYEQASDFWAILKRVLTVMALLFVISSVILGIITFFRASFGKLTWRRALPRIAPMLGLVFLVWAIYYLFEVNEFSYKLAELDTINLHTLIIFLGPTFFGIISIISLLSSIRNFRKESSPWMACYLLLTSVSYCLVTFILLQSGWIGLRTWAL